MGNINNSQLVKHITHIYSGDEEAYIKWHAHLRQVWNQNHYETVILKAKMVSFMPHIKLKETKDMWLTEATNREARWN